MSTSQLLRAARVDGAGPFGSFRHVTLPHLKGVLIVTVLLFARFRFAGRSALFFSVLFRNMFPAVVFLIPLFIMMRWSPRSMRSAPRTPKSLW